MHTNTHTWSFTRGLSLQNTCTVAIKEILLRPPQNLDVFQRSTMNPTHKRINTRPSLCTPQPFSMVLFAFTTKYLTMRILAECCPCTVQKNSATTSFNSDGSAHCASTSNVTSKIRIFDCCRYNFYSKLFFTFALTLSYSMSFFISFAFRCLWIVFLVPFWPYFLHVVH